MSYDLGVLNLQGEKKKKRTRMWVSVGVLVVAVGVALWYFLVYRPM